MVATSGAIRFEEMPGGRVCESCRRALFIYHDASRAASDNHCLSDLRTDLGDRSYTDTSTVHITVECQFVTASGNGRIAVADSNRICP